MRTALVLVGVLALTGCGGGAGESEEVARLRTEVSELRELAATTTTARPITTTTERVTTTTTTPSTTTTTTTTRRPNGALHFTTGPSRGFGQSPGGTSGCTSWHGELSNFSDTGVTDIVFTAAHAEWSNGDYNPETGQTWPANPLPASLDLYLAPGQTVEVRFRICTDTPAPPGAVRFSTQRLSFAWNWVQG